MTRPFAWKDLGLALVVAAGIFLRLLWPQDMEYKADEWRMYAVTQQAGVTMPWPSLGMPSGVRLPNPPLSAWFFIAASKALGIRDPIALDRFVELLNSLALLALAAFVFTLAREGKRSPEPAWVWTIALAAVNPSSLVLQRKIWAQSVLPLFCVAGLALWWRRERPWAAFGIGMLGMLLGQIHMSGFFFLLALTAGLWIFARGETRWRALIAGACVGALPLVPWVLAVRGAHANGTPLNPFSVRNLFEARFWILWATDAAGLDLRASLGSNLGDFLRGPKIGSFPTYLCGALSLGLALAWGAVLIRATLAWLPRIRFGDLADRRSKSDQILLSGFLIYGAIMTLLPFPFVRHYLLVAYPLVSYWLARLALGHAPAHATKLLAATVLAHAVLSASFLLYIHQNGGAGGGDYGEAYRLQTPAPTESLRW